MVKQKVLDSENLWLFLLLVLSTAVRVFFLLNYENMPGNATDSIVRALDMIDNPSLLINFDGNRSTLFNYALASFLYFWRDPVLAPRVFTLIFGVLLVLPYYGTLKILFDRRIAFLSSLVLVACPLHVVQSTTATVDVFYYFFVFASFYYFFRFWSGQGGKAGLWLAGLLFNIVSLTRFESWIFIPFFFLLLWPKERGAAFKFLILSTIFPCAWLLFNQVMYHDFLLTFKKAALTAHTEIVGGTVPYDPRVISWIVVLWRSSGASLVLGGFLGVLLSIVSRKKYELALFLLTLLSAFTINSCSGRMWHTERYSIILVLMLIPYAWFFVDKALTFLEIRKTVFFVLLLVLPARDIVKIVQKPIDTIPHVFSLMTKEIRSVALWLKDNVRQEETIIIGADRFDVYPSYLMLRGGIFPSGRCLTTWNTTRPLNSREEFEKYIWEHRTQYLVLNSEGYLQKLLNMDLAKKRQEWGGVTFEVMFKQKVILFGEYLIYRISYGELPERKVA